MHIEAFRLYCLGLKGVEESLPFNREILVFKVMGKMFAATSLNEEEFRVNLKCDPEWAIDLRASYPDIIPGWHMNKKHWNTVYLERDTIEEELIIRLIDHSYERVVSGLKKSDKQALDNL